MKLIAENSVLINAAMRKQTDSSKVAQKWLAHDATKAVTPEDVQSAKNWVKINVQMDSIPLKNALKKIYGSGWAFGATDAKNEISSEIGFNWDDWEPGNEAAAALADAPRGLRTMLDRRGATIKGLNDVTLDRIGSSLALSLSQGLSMEETANMIDYILDDPLRSMVIARTETADALVQANIAEYRDNEISQIQWLVGDPCDICAQNANEIVDIGETFSSGDQYPPAHPNCVCDVSPIVRFSEGEDVELAISPDAIKEEGYKANAGMKAAAKRAIEWRAEGHKGGTQVGATRASQIVSGEAMSADTVKRMYSFFSRHEVDKKATGFNSGEEGYPSPGRVAWDLWGGNAGFTWSRQIVERLKRDESKSANSDLNKYDEDQPRDELGRFGSGSGSGSGSSGSPIENAANKIVEKTNALKKQGAEFVSIKDFDQLVEADRSLIALADRTINDPDMQMTPEDAIEGDRGFHMTQEALNFDARLIAEHESQVVVLRDSSGEVAGAALTHLDASPNGETVMEMKYLGTTGIVDGAGSALFGNAINFANAEGLGLQLYALDSEAYDFWTSMGFAHESGATQFEPNEPLSMSSDDVAAIAEKIK